MILVTHARATECSKMIIGRVAEVEAIGVWACYTRWSV
jgi:hypothetical protein